MRFYLTHFILMGGLLACSSSAESGNTTDGGAGGSGGTTGAGAGGSGGTTGGAAGAGSGASSTCPAEPPAGFCDTEGTTCHYPDSECGESVVCEPSEPGNPFELMWETYGPEKGTPCTAETGSICTFSHEGDGGAFVYRAICSAGVWWGQSTHETDGWAAPCPAQLPALGAPCDEDLGVYTHCNYSGESSCGPNFIALDCSDGVFVHHFFGCS